MAEKKKEKVTWRGPDGQVNAEIGEPLENGKSYEVEADLAERLTSGSAFWTGEGETLKDKQKAAQEEPDEEAKSVED